jgi:ligand-binding sensor domain-containing protein
MVAFLVLVVLFAAVAEAQADLPARAPSKADLSQYVHHVWRRAQGLPQDSVSAVLQTRDGYLWLGTQEGLARFDGVRFTLFNKANTAAFTHNDVFALAEGRDGSLWIGTYGGLLQWKAGEFVSYPTRENRERDVATCLAVDGEGAVWVGTQNGGLNRFKDGRFEFYSAGQGLPSPVVNDVEVDATGAVWIATPAGLSVLRGTTWTRYDHRSGLPGTVVWQVLPGRDGTVWVGTDQGLAAIREGAVTALDLPAALARASVRILFQDRLGAVWAGTDDGVVWRHDADASTSLVLAPGTSGNTVLTITEDREGSLWIGTYITGLHRLWRGRFDNLTRQHGLGDDSVRAILQTRSGEVWISTEAAGLSRFDGRSVVNYTREDGLPHDVARALFEDSRGTFWVGTRAGLCRFDRGRFRSVSSAAGSNIRALAEDAGGTLWVGTNDGVFRLVNDRLTELASDGRTRLPRGIVRSISRDRAGAIWVGTNDTLTRWRDSAFTTFTAEDGVPSDAIYAVHEDEEGTYWFGSYGGGLARLKDGKIARFRQADGLFDDVVFRILEDGRNNLWISCNNGIFRVSKADLDAFAAGKITRLTSVAYDSGDGMVSSECNGNAQPAGWKTSDGRLWFPTTKGAVIVDPADLRKNDLAPLVAVERVVANKRPYSLASEGVVPPGAGQVEMSFTGLSFISPRKVQFRYRLAGLEKDWVDAGDRRQTVYTNLSPGRYVFHVTASNNDGVWSPVAASYAFVLQPHLYETAWFRALCVMAAVAVALVGYRVKMWRHVQRERELTRRVEQALGRIKVLGGLIPICANCKKIRDDSGYWSQLEQYLRTHSEATFSHGICPECVERLYPEYVEPGDDRPAV